MKSKDPIMVSIMSNNYSKLEVNAIINDDEIIPGISGCVIDKDKSYSLMKSIGKYNEDLLVYKNILPSISLNNNYDKYIVSGNKINRNVSFVIYIAKDINVIKNINEKINIFLDSSLLENGYIDIPNKNIHIYNGGTYLNYNNVNIEWMNDVIEEFYNESSYCLNINKNSNNLYNCSSNNMYSIKPSIVLDNLNVKKDIVNGSIIYVREDDIKYLNSIIKYVKSKGYNIVYLDELLSEEKCK